MDIQMLKPFFMWCTIINGSLSVVWAISSIYARDFIYRMHSKCFSLSQNTVDVALYVFLGVFKIIFLFFNVVPYIALLIVG